MKNKSRIAILVVLGGLLAYGVYHYAVKSEVHVANSMRFEVVRSASEQQRGLSGRTQIPENYGMLFVFQTPDLYGIWMKDMLVPIDIIWLANDGSIIGIESRVDPSTYPTAFYPPEPVRYVLETKSGYAEEMGWHVGNIIVLPENL